MPPALRAMRSTRPLGHRQEGAVDVLARPVYVRIGAGRVTEAPLEPGVRGDLALAALTHRTFCQLVNLPERDLDLVEEGGAAEKLEHSARGQEPVGLGAPQVHRDRARSA